MVRKLYLNKTVFKQERLSINDKDSLLIVLHSSLLKYFMHVLPLDAFIILWRQRLDFLLICLPFPQTTMSVPYLYVQILDTYKVLDKKIMT